MVTLGFIKAEMSKLQKQIDEAREKYSYTGSPSTLKTIERNEDMIHCLEYARAHKLDINEGYRIFSINAKALRAHCSEIVESELTTDEKLSKILKAIDGMSYWRKDGESNEEQES